VQDKVGQESKLKSRFSIKGCSSCCHPNSRHVKKALRCREERALAQSLAYLIYLCQYHDRYVARLSISTNAVEIWDASIRFIGSQSTDGK
jgi:hypothetical protein